MKILLFGHTPPPVHGQSRMLQQMLDAFGGDAVPRHASDPFVLRDDDISFYHVNCRLSTEGVQIGRVLLRKIPLLFFYCFQAIYYRFRYDVRHFLYVPAPAKTSAICRDWMVMALCRPFFKTVVLYWHAGGLGEWLSDHARGWQRRLTYALLGNPNLSIVLGEACRGDADALNSRRTVVIPNCIPDPCPDFRRALLPQRIKRAELCGNAVCGRGRSHQMGDECDDAVQIFRVLFIGLCLREKGLFDAIEAVAVVNQQLVKRKANLRVHLHVAGNFRFESERAEFEERIMQPDLMDDRDMVWDRPSSEEVKRCVVQFHGFVSGEAKKRLLVESDCLCFPSYYPRESCPLVVLEAMAYGLPVITTKWRNIPALVSPEYDGFVEPRCPEAIAAVMMRYIRRYSGTLLRGRFEAEFSDIEWLSRMRRALVVVC